jgi:hypothetical protein
MMLRIMCLVSLAGLAAGCGNGDPFADADPRCAALCRPEDPVDDVGEICSMDSAEVCLTTCAARIADTSSLCATCLLENARFQVDDVISPGDDCSPTECTMTGWGGTCTYPPNDSAARDACYRQTHPLREVACEADFRPVTDCASVCT